MSAPRPKPPPPPPIRAAAEPWERQPGEGARAFAHFRAYRDMGSTRSHATVVQTVGSLK